MKLKEIFMYSFAAVIALGFFGILIYMIRMGTYETSINLVVGALVGSFTLVVGYFFGSSKGSADKNDILKKKE
jgi:heme O synthase-like polyprenyltransferase